MSDLNDPKQALRHYLQSCRDSLLWKLDGLSERAVRMPRTPTGTNLLGLVKHAAGTELGYFGDAFGRVWEGPEIMSDDDPQADFYATAQESTADIVQLYRDVWVFADQTIATLPLDARGRVPWWPAERAEITLGRAMLHVVNDLARHAGHADILREQLDQAAGLNPRFRNLPDAFDWAAYTAKLTAIAEQVGD